jgi:transposase InsO family protein
VAAAGIDIERIKPGCPQQNGRHERMHLTLKKETTKPAGANFLQQPGSMTSSTSQTVGIKQAEDHIWLARRFNL